MYTLAFDPGGSTGWSVWHDERGFLRGGQLTGEDHSRLLYSLIKDVFGDNRQGVVVVEMFEQRGMATKVDVRAYKYIAAIELICEAMDIEIVKQRPTDVKSFWTDAKLKRLGLYFPGKPHQNDAVRHLLSYICGKDSEQRSEIFARLRPVEVSNADEDDSARRRAPQPSSD